MSATRVVVADVSNQTIKLLCLEKQGKGYHVKCAQSHRLDGDKKQAERIHLAQAFRQIESMANESRVSIKDCLISLNGSSTLFKYTHVPFMSVNKFKKLMDFELSINLEQTAGDNVSTCGDFITLDFCEDTDEQFVMFSLVQEALLEDIRITSKSVNIKRLNFNHGALGLYHCVRHIPSLVDIESAIMIVDIGTDSSTMSIVKQGHLYFSRILNQGGAAFERFNGVSENGSEEPASSDSGALEDPDAQSDDSAEALPADVAIAKQVKAFASGLKSSMMYARVQLRMPKLDISHVYITGEGAQRASVQEIIAENLDTPCLAIPTEEIIGQVPSDEPLSTSFATVYGTGRAYLEGGMSVDYATVDAKKKHLFWQNKAFSLYAASIFLIATITMVVFANKRLAIAADQEQQLSGLLSKAKKYDKIHQASLEKFETIKIQGDYLHRRFNTYNSMSYLIARFKALSSKRIVFKQVRMGEQTFAMIKKLLNEDFFLQNAEDNNKLTLENLELPENLDQPHMQPFAISGYVFIKGSETQAYDVLNEFVDKLEDDKKIQDAFVVSAKKTDSEDGKHLVLLFSVRLQVIL